MAAENPKLVSLADLNGDNGTEFLEKCVNNWNSWVELTSTLKEVEEKNAALIHERMNFARQLENSLKDAQEKQEKIERLNMEMSVQRMKLNKKIWNLTKITCALVVALLLIIITAIILGLYLHYNF